MFSALNERYILLLESIKVNYPYTYIEINGAWFDLYEEKLLLETELEYYFKELEGSVLELE